MLKWPHSNNLHTDKQSSHGQRIDRMMSEQEWNELPDQDKVTLILQKHADAHRYLLAMLVRLSAQGIKGELKTDETIDEVAKQAYITIISKIETFAFEAKLSTWCYTIVARKVIDFQRRYGRKQGKDVPFPPVLPDPHTQERFDLRIPPEAVCRRIWPCWQEVCATTRQRRDLKVWLQIDLKDDPPQLAADRWGISRNNANVIATRIRQKLQSCLKGRGYASSQELASL